MLKAEDKGKMLKAAKEKGNPNKVKGWLLMRNKAGKQQNNIFKMFKEKSINQDSCAQQSYLSKMKVK